MKDRNDNQHTDKGWEPRTAPSGEDAMNTDERSLDVGESGQFAPGGYYNQQGINASDRRSLDDDIVPPSRR